MGHEGQAETLNHGSGTDQISQAIVQALLTCQPGKKEKLGSWASATVVPPRELHPPTWHLLGASQKEGIL